jgi:hypothetical protein
VIALYKARIIDLEDERNDYKNKLHKLVGLVKENTETSERVALHAGRMSIGRAKQYATQKSKEYWQSKLASQK